MKTMPALCNSCKRLQPDGWRCEAFPDGIPVPIAFDGADHRDPFPGDNGVRYEQDPAKLLEFSDWFHTFGRRQPEHGVV